MSEVNAGEELRKAQVEPLLPVEKKLIGWSLGIGLVALVVLAIVNQLFPASIYGFTELPALIIRAWSVSGLVRVPATRMVEPVVRSPTEPVFTTRMTVELPTWTVNV